MTSRDDPYADLVSLYDLEHAEFREDVDLYLKLAEVVGDPVLELGCGTGRVLVPLASAGFRVTGVDRSSAMLDRARSAIDDAGASERATVVNGGMTEGDRAPGGPFGLVIFALNGLHHLASAAEQRAALVSARRALDPRGMLVIDAMNPTPDLLLTFDGRVEHEGTWELADGTRVDRFAARTHSASEQRIETRLWYDLLDQEGRLRRVQTRFPLRYVFCSELELLLEATRFAEWRVYGSYDLDPYRDESDRLLVTAEVTPS